MRSLQAERSLARAEQNGKISDGFGIIVEYAAACGSFELLAAYVGLDSNPEKITSSAYVACYESSLCMPKRVLRC